jgi:hypothetical protein
MGYIGSKKRQRVLGRLYARKWHAAHPEYKEHRRKYRQKNRAKHAAYNLRWYHVNRKSAIRRRNARWAVSVCLMIGFIKKPKKCEICRKEKSLQGHHHKGYAKKNWLNVQWICQSCHNFIEPRNNLKRIEKTRFRARTSSECSKIRWARHKRTHLSGHV